MKPRVDKFVATSASSIAVLAMTVIGVAGQSGAAGGEWRTYGGDLGSTRYSKLGQIDASNFDKLEIAWRFETDYLGPRPEFDFQSTPLMVNGVLYSTGGSRRAVVTLDAATGELLWMQSESSVKRRRGSSRAGDCRIGHDGKEERILYVTPGYQLVALQARTGQRVPGFGNGGIVDLKLDDDQVMDLVTGDVGLHAAPVVAKDIVLIGAAHLTGRVPKSRANVKGYVRGYDVRTGKRLWILHTIPVPGEFGNDTWEKDSWSYTGNTGVWAQMTVDEELGIVYLPVETPTGDEYCGERPANGLFGESLVALDLKTGSVFGTTSSSTMASGTGTFLAPRSSPISPSTAQESRLSPSRPSRRSSMSSIGLPKLPSGRSKNDPYLRVRLPAKRLVRRSHFRPSPRPSIFGDL
jgi:quinoprotein glucose dehydrogenase